jgi:hypothetical protein
MYRSPHNAPQIQSMVDLTSENVANPPFAGVYNLKGVVKPEFDRVFSNPIFRDKLTLASFYKNLSSKISYFHDKLSKIIQIKDQLKGLKKEPLENKIIELSERAFKKTQDEVLEYSIVFDAFQRDLITDSVLLEKQKAMQKRGIDCSELEKKFKQHEKSNYPNPAKPRP